MKREKKFRVAVPVRVGELQLISAGSLLYGVSIFLLAPLMMGLGFFFRTEIIGDLLSWGAMGVAGFAIVLPGLIARGGRSGCVQISFGGGRIELPGACGHRIVGIGISCVAIVSALASLAFSVSSVGVALLSCVGGFALLGFWAFLFVRAPHVSFSAEEIFLPTMFSVVVVGWDDLVESFADDSWQIFLSVKGGELPFGTWGNKTDPRILASIISFYRLHPELRHELAGGAVIDRIREGRLPIDWELGVGGGS